MGVEQQIEQLLQQNLEEEYFVTQIKYNPGRQKAKLIVHIDGDQGIGIDKCADISRWLGEMIENQQIIPTAYTLEVSSPGVGASLKLKRQYTSNIGRLLEITLQDDALCRGKLTALLEEGIVIEPENTKKNKKTAGSIQNNDTKILLWEDIKKTIVLVSF